MYNAITVSNFRYLLVNLALVLLFHYWHGKNKYESINQEPEIEGKEKWEINMEIDGEKNNLPNYEKWWKDFLIPIKKWIKMRKTTEWDPALDNNIINCSKSWKIAHTINDEV